MTRWWRSHSVRVRLTLWYVAAMIVILGVYAAVVYGFVRRSVSETLDQQLRSDFSWAAAMVAQTPEGRVTWYKEEETFGAEELPWLQVWSPDGRELLFKNTEAQSRPIPDDQSLAQQADNVIRTVTVPGDPIPVRVLSVHERIGPRPVVLQVARTEYPMRLELRKLALILMFGLPVAVALAGFGGFALASRALAPVERMTERARLISAERLTDRLPVDNPDDELGRLAAVFNETLGRLQTSFDQMRQFTSDVSHELRTPLTAIRSVGEVGLRGHRDVSAYRSVIGSMLEEADRLASLVDRLLTLSRAETGQAHLSRQAIDLRELAENVVSHLSVLAEEKRQTIAIEGRRVDALADRLILRQALINLVDNAIKYSPAGGRILIRVDGIGEDAVVDVVDSGHGIPDEARRRIFDRFYRVEDGGATHGAGLGLSLARGAVEANGGRLTLETTGPGGSTFRITIPRASSERHRAAG